MNSKIIGGILLIVGTSIGGGMLALPIATAQAGFIGALVLILGAWLFMTLGALLILEVNLWFPEDSNLVSMVRHTLGRPAEIIAWVCYLLLLYSLLAAYIAGGSDIFSLFFYKLNFNLPDWVTAFIFAVFWGAIVSCGIKTIDIVNRILMFVKMTSLFGLLAFIIPHTHVVTLATIHSAYLVGAITVVITSFGFATIVPSLRSYFDSDIKILRRIVIYGSMVPLLCYIAWVGAIMGEIPVKGAYGLLAIINSQHTTAMLTQSLIIFLKNSRVSDLASTFTSICVITSFLGVALCLSDFLADGFNLKKTGVSKAGLYLLTFVPPFLLVVIDPGLFLAGLSYAGVFCVILLALLPALMAWKGRYQMGLKSDYQVTGGKFLLSILVLISILIITYRILIILHLL